jgi:hypothetical protein
VLERAELRRQEQLCVPLVKIDGRWYFAERKLILDWSETRAMAAAAAASGT